MRNNASLNKIVKKVNITINQFDEISNVVKCKNFCKKECFLLIYF